MPEGHITSVLARWWMEEVTERTNGQVQFEAFYAGVLGKGKDQPDNIKAGLFDFGYFLAAYDPAKTPLLTLPYAPWVPSKRGEVRLRAFWEVTELPAAKAELAAWDAMCLIPAQGMGDVYYLYTVDKPVYTLDDIAGLKVRSVGRMAEALALAGASPVAMPMPDVYDALSKGTLDAGALATSPFLGYKLYEVLNYMSTVLLGSGSPMVIMKLSVFNNLPADIQKVIMDVSYEAIEWFIKAEADQEKEFDDIVKQYGITVIEFPAEEQKRYEDLAVMPVMEEWIKDMEDQGLPGREAFWTFRDAAEKYEK